MGWDGMGWDGMGWDGMGWRSFVYFLSPAPAHDALALGVEKKKEGGGFAAFTHPQTHTQ